MSSVRRDSGRTLAARALSVSGIIVLVLAAQGTAAVAQNATPDLSGVYTRGLYMKPPPGIDTEVILPSGGVIPGMYGPGPIRHQTGADLDTYFAMGDSRMPTLKFRAREAVTAHNAATAAGTITPPSTQTCVPSGLFMQLTNPGAMRITQTPEQITLEFESDGDTRVIHMNAEHPADLEPSMNGYSIGRWEGDTLVVDTIGIDERSLLDRYGTPHSTALHVVERVRLIKNGEALENYVFGEDTPNFFAPWWGVVTYARSDEAWNDQVCDGQ